MRKIRLYAGRSENLTLVDFEFNSVLTNNVISAENQQATPLSMGSPQRLHVEYPKKRMKITNEEATLLGILFTDGCVSKKSKNCWRFYLGNTSFEIIQTFSECITNIFSLDSKRVRISQKLVNGKPYYKAVVDSGYCGNVLISKYGTFRTLAYKDGDGKKTFPSTHLPFSSSTNKKVLSEFLKAAFSCDGGVNLYVAKVKTGYRFLIRNVYLSCYHPQLQSEYQKLLSLLGIKAKIILKDHRILVQGRDELRKFKEKISFLNGVRITQHSAYWQGREKNEVLNLILSSYGKPKSILNLPQFLG